MSDKNLELTRRKALLGLGGIGAGAAFGGAGTMALLNDKEKSENNTVTAGKLDLKLDWVTFYKGKELYTDVQPPANNPGPMFTVNDAKPGDVGGGCISLHVKDNPALIWAACDLKQWENGRGDPEKYVDDDDEGELAKKIKVALLKVPIVTRDNIGAEANQMQGMMQNNGDISENEIKGLHSDSYLVHFTNLKDLCEEKLHGGKLLDAKPFDRRKKCFQPSNTYWYCFLWWIPHDVGNEIQSDKVEFDLKFGAVQCRHVKNPERHNPFKNNAADSSEGSD